MEIDNAEKLKIVKDSVKTYENFPKKGIIYKDIFGIFQNARAIKALNDLLIDHVNTMDVDIIVGLDSRGFLLGPLISVALDKPFVPIRKKGKLPGIVKQESYTLEYGEATFEIQTESISNGNRVVIVDDLLATGGSMAAAIKLLKATGADVVECLVIMELTPLNGRARLGVPLHSFIQYD